MTLQERVQAKQAERYRVANAWWCDSHSGRETWHVTEIAPLGFWYDGEGFFAPRFKGWSE